MHKIFRLLNDHETGMSKFQDDYFVTMRTGGTLYGQYKQALRELYKRYRGLREQTFNRKRLDVDIAEAKHKAETLENEFEKQRAEIDLGEKTAQIEEAERVIKDTKREFLNFYSQANYYKEQLGELTEERHDELEREMWVHKVKGMAAVDIITQGRITIGTLDLLRSFPQEMRLLTLAEIKDHNKLIAWYENDNTEFLPDNLVLDVDINTVMEAIEC